MNEKLYCFRCGSQIEKETDEALKKQYPYFCPFCDENIFTFETRTADELLKSFLPMNVDFGQFFADKTKNHYEYKGIFSRVLIFDDKYFFDNENKYENEVSRGEFTHPTFNGSLYFIIDSVL